MFKDRKNYPERIFLPPTYGFKLLHAYSPSMGVTQIVNVRNQTTRRYEKL